MIEILPVLKGALTYVPYLYDSSRFDSTGIEPARYCYAVWLRHLVALHRLGKTFHPTVVAELGPGPSLGVCVAAVLTGSERGLALDIVDFVRSNENMAIAKEIHSLIEGRADIPDDVEMPGMYPKLDDYRFPRDVLPERRLAAALSRSRLKELLVALDPSSDKRDDALISYQAPWFSSSVLRPNSVDLIVSQAVLEHVDQLDKTYAAMSQWLKPGGCASHVIDFRSHSLTKHWDGHLQYSPRLWSVVRGRRPYLLNRVAPTQHCALALAAGLKTIACDRVIAKPSISRSRLPRPFADWTQDDRSTSTMHLVLQSAANAIAITRANECASQSSQ